VDSKRAVEQLKVGKEWKAGSRGRCGSGVRFILEVGHRAYLSAMPAAWARTARAAGTDFRMRGAVSRSRITDKNFITC
jgi:hypothetical protein